MGQARRKRATGNPSHPLGSAREPMVREAVLRELEQGRPKPSVVVVDATTAATNLIPIRIVDDGTVTGVPGAVSGSPMPVHMYATIEQFAKDAVTNYPRTLEQVRQRLTAYPDDVVLITVEDHGVHINNIEITVKAPNGRELTLEQLSKEAMDDLLRKAVKRAIAVYGLDTDAEPNDEMRTKIVQGLLNIVAETLVGEPHPPAVMGIWPDKSPSGWSTIEKFERTRNESARHKVWKEQVREAVAAYPDRIIFCVPDDRLKFALRTAKETQTGFTVWAVDTKSMPMQITRCGRHA